MKPDSQDLLRLADELMAATGPDRRLDYWIMTRTLPTGHAYLWDPEDQNHRYTASLDAAGVLVPTNSLWAVGSDIDGPFARVMPPVRDGWVGSEQQHCLAATPPLALCAAALKARAHSTKETSIG